MSSPKIKALIVEDNPEHELLLRSLLESSDVPEFLVLWSGTVTDACEKLRTECIGIVLLDMTLPDSHGVRTFERVSAASGDTPIVVLSGEADVNLAVQTVQLGAQDYLVKGHVDNNLLLRSIQYAIERKRAQVELKRAYDELELRVSERTAALRDANDSLQREIDERKRAESQSLDSNRQLMDALAELRTMQGELVHRERLKALGQMASGIAHEFNNVLTPVLGYSEHLLSHPEVLADHERARGYIAKIAEAARSGAKAIARVRDFSRAEAGERGPVSIEDVVQSSVSLTEPYWRDEAQMAGKTISVAQKLHGVQDVLSDPGQLRELLMQLIFNSVKAIEKRGMISISAEQRGGGVAISVTDDGSGMSAAERLRLLDPKRCASSEANGRDGYEVIHAILERNGGRLEIASALGSGTKVTVVLPAHASSLPVLPVPAPAPPPVPPGPPAAARILVADDEPMVRDVISIYLAEDGHLVEVAENGREAFEMFQKSDYDIVLSDRAMPEMNGDQLAVEVKKLKPKVPVILLTGYGDAMNSEGDIPNGVDAVVAKPFTMTSLREALSQFLGS